MEANLAYATSNRLSAKHLALPMEQKRRCRHSARLALPMRCVQTCVDAHGGLSLILRKKMSSVGV